MKKSFAENPPSTSPVDDQDTPQPPKQTPQRPPTPSRQYQDITLGFSSSSSSSSTFNYNEHILNSRQEEKEGTLLHKRSNNINNEVHSLLAPATSQEEFNSPDSNLLTNIETTEENIDGLNNVFRNVPYLSAPKTLQHQRKEPNV